MWNWNWQGNSYTYSHVFFSRNKQTRGPWTMIHLPDKNSYWISTNVMQFLPVLPQPLGYKFDYIIKRSKVILVSHHFNKLSRLWVPDAVYQDSASELSSREEDFYMCMAAILLDGAEPVEKIVNILSTDGPMWTTCMWNLVKTIQAISEKKTLKDFTILYMYIAQRQGQIAPKILTVAEQFN